jgi:hypothetical protein
MQRSLAVSVFCLTMLGGCAHTKVVQAPEISCQLPILATIEGAESQGCESNDSGTLVCCMFSLSTKENLSCIFALCLIVRDEAVCPTSWELAALKCREIRAL